MYEPIPYDEVGGEPRFVYGKHSGSNGLYELLNSRASEVGHVIDREFVSGVLEEIKNQREIRVCLEETTRFIADYYGNLRHLSISEDEVIELAKDLAGRVSARDQYVTACQ